MERKNGICQQQKCRPLPDGVGNGLEMNWKWFGKILEVAILGGTLFCESALFNSNDLPMKTNDFSIFRTLLSDVHVKAFGEPLGYLPHGKAQVFSWLIQDATGELLSYKSLRNFTLAVLENNPARVNPSAATLSILVRFIYGNREKGLDACLAWYQYRTQVLVAPVN